MGRFVSALVLLFVSLVDAGQLSYAEGPQPHYTPVHSSYCDGDHHLDQAVFDSIWQVDDYFTPNTMARIGPYTPSFPRHLPLLRLVRRCPNLRDDAVRRLAANTDVYPKAFDAIILANLLPRAEDAVREVVRAIPAAIKQRNVLVEVTEDCAVDRHFGPCDKMDAAIRAENGGQIPSYPWR